LSNTTARSQIFGVSIDTRTMDQTVERCRRLIEARHPTHHVSLNAGKVVLMQDQPGLRAIVSSSDLVSADGMSIVWGARFLGHPVPERVAGIDLMARLLELAESEQWPVYFHGARPAALSRFLEVVRQRHPTLRIAGSSDGYSFEGRRVAESIARSGARLLFVGISSPLKERFLAEYLPNMGEIFAMGVGGSFDVWAGVTRRAPEWMQRVGLEWFYRFLQEPRRMWRRYVFGNARFAWLLLQERFGPPRKADKTGKTDEAEMKPGMKQC
jgi:N-acetylglucosaminyldiphosphoundecaprenol N-acetyl-beta-D-mannosaminyltransferase